MISRGGVDATKAPMAAFSRYSFQTTFTSMVNDPETLDPEAASRGPVKGSIQPRSTIMEARETRAPGSVPVWCVNSCVLTADDETTVVILDKSANSDLSQTKSTLAIENSNRSGPSSMGPRLWLILPEGTAIGFRLSHASPEWSCTRRTAQ